MVPAALYLAEVNSNETTTDLFVEWLSQNVEQLRPTNPDDLKTIEEAIAKLTVSPDVTLEVSIDKGADEPEVTTEPAIVEPEADPVAADPVITEPEVIEPEATEPEIETDTPTLPPFEAADEGGEGDDDEDESESEEETDSEDEDEEDDEDLKEAVNKVQKIIK
jgi:hypothetical protein